MWRLGVLLTWVTACSFAPAAVSGDARHADAPADGAAGDADAATTTMPDATACFDVDGLGLHVCLAHSPSGARTISTPTAITTTGMPSPCEALAASSDPACVLSGDTLVIAPSTTLSGSGSLPLVLVANTEIEVTGAIDVASHTAGPLAGQIGTMADGASCGAGGAPQARGGGAGGSYGSSGGAGGDDGNGSAGGTAAPVLPLALHGGCAGQQGGNGGGSPGAGGGLVVLIAPTIAIDATGVIDASGAGGESPTADTTRGGGGGGSGGVIVLQATTVKTSPGAQVFANGGGGSGGSNGMTAGNPGTDPAGAGGKPDGGAGGGQAGDGGDGFYTTHKAQLGTPGMNGSDGGGGGGGGGGVIHLPAGATIQGGGVFSPAVT